jgi:hypothetical protein
MVSDFTALFQGGPLGAVQGAKKMANIYATYAKAGMFGLSVPQFTGAEEAILAATLAAVFALPVPNPAAFGLAWSAGLTTFWLAPPILVTGVQAGAVAAIPGAAAVTAPLLALVAIPANPAPVAASMLAVALHAATMTCIAAVVPPPGTTLPII